MNQSPQNLLANSDEIYSANAVSEAIDSLASQITEVLSKTNPIVMSVMGGAVVFTGQL
jgi:hypoxanthine phosphoribosyltransferase